MLWEQKSPSMRSLLNVWGPRIVGPHLNDRTWSIHKKRKNGQNDQCLWGKFLNFSRHSKLNSKQFATLHDIHWRETWQKKSVIIAETVGNLWLQVQGDSSWVWKSFKVKFVEFQDTQKHRQWVICRYISGIFWWLSTRVKIALGCYQKDK